MDGLLLVDKPAGPTSHDVVARMRRVLRERRIGHTGTLDPAATGLLPLVVGRATRLARFVSGSDKTYDAAIRIGVSTATGDAHGDPVAAAYAGQLPSRETIDRALDAFRGTYPQRPPAFSAKKIAGQRSYQLARRPSVAGDNLPPRPIQPAAVNVTAHAILIAAYDGCTLTLRVDCSAGFYIRSLAHDLGQRLGTGAHLTALRRTRTGAFTVDEAIPLVVAEQYPDRAAAAIIPMAGMLRHWSAVVLTAEGVRRAMSGRDLGPSDIQDASEPAIRREPTAAFVRLVDDGGDLIGLAEPAATPGLLHPSVVLR